MILQRRYLKDFILLLIVVVSGLALVMGAFEITGKLQDYSEYDAPFFLVFQLALLSLPRQILYILPMGALLSGMFTVGHAARNLELTAFVASGGRMKRLLFPFVLTGILMSILSLAVGEIVVPMCAEAAADIEERIVQRRAVAVSSVNGTTWLRSEDGSVVKMDLYLQEDNSFRGISVFELEGSRIGRIVRAERARYIQGKNSWVLEDVNIYSPATGEMKNSKELDWPHLSPPSVFMKRVRKPYEMGIIELKQYIDRLKEAGFRNMRLEVEMHTKLSYPLVNLFVLVLGISFAARRTIGGFFAAAFSLIFTLAYWFGYMMMLTMGFAGIVSPLAAVWSMPLAFGGLSAWLYARIPE
jgi:lipopolysaccharide export system permease protein